MSTLPSTAWIPKIGDIVEFRLGQGDGAWELGKIKSVSDGGFCEVRPLHRSQTIVLESSATRTPRKAV